MGCPAATRIGEDLVFSVTTHDPDTGVVTDADAVPDYWVYEDENGASILNGAMAKLDDANTTGFYTELIQCTAGNGFEDGKNYTVYIEAEVGGDKGAISYGFKAYTDPADVVLAELTGIADAPATPTRDKALMLLYMWLRNDSQSTNTERRIFNDAGAEILDATCSDDGTTFSQGKLTAP